MTQTGRSADGPATSRTAVRDGLVASLALVPSVFVYGTVFGGLAVQAGLRSLEVLGMSLLVFAGAAQFVAVPMIAAGVSPLAIVLTTYIVNMRHYLMAATLADNRIPGPTADLKRLLAGRKQFLERRTAAGPGAHRQGTDADRQRARDDLQQGS